MPLTQSADAWVLLRLAGGCEAAGALNSLFRPRLHLLSQPNQAEVEILDTGSL
jgi:hypothetical protein